MDSFLAPLNYIFLLFFIFVKCNYYCKVRIQMKSTKNSHKICTAIDNKFLRKYKLERFVKTNLLDDN